MQFLHGRILLWFLPLILLVDCHSAHSIDSIGLILHEENRCNIWQNGFAENQRLETSRSLLLRLRGGRKGVSAKHTSSEIARKTAEATTNKGGGKAGLIDRLGGAAGHAKFICPHCKMQAPSLKNMEEHHESKHDSIPFDPSACENAHMIHGGSTKGIGVHGTLRKAKLKAKEKKTGDD